MIGPSTWVILLASVVAAESKAQGPAPSKTRPNDLLKSAPFDRITLIDGSAFEIEPLSPRPLPPVDPKKSRNLADIDEAAKKAEQRRTRKADPFTKREEDEEDQPLIIHLVEGEPRDFKVKRASVKSIEYFEDLVLAESDRLIREGDFTRAFERLILIRSRDPGWRGLDDRVNRLLFEEGSAALVSDNARGLLLLNELNARKPDFPGLADKLAASFARRISRALEVGDFLAGRRLLRELEVAAPDHPEGRAIRSQFLGRAKALVAEAARSSATDRVDKLAEAARVWPQYEGLEAAYRESFKAQPTLTVAVVDVAESIGPFPRSPASERVARLLYLPSLINDDDPALRGEPTGQLLSGLEVLELGKLLRVRLRTGPTWSDQSRPVSSIDLARSLADRALVDSPGFNARWAELLAKVDVVDEERVEIRLTRPSLKPEVWLLEPVGPAHAAADGWVSVAGQGRFPAGDGPFRWVPGGSGTTLQRVEPGDPAGSSKIRRVREVRYPDPDAAREALIRGDVAILEHVSPDRVGDMIKDPAYKVGRYATPSVHQIAIDGRNPLLRSRKLRRALSLAIDRKSLLEEVILRRPPDEANRVADGPAIQSSSFNSPNVPPLEYNPILAKGLAAAARKELGGAAIKFTLEYPTTSEARAACPRIAEALTLIGLEIELIERSESELEQALRSGKRFDLAYRASRPARPLRDLGPLLVPAYDASPSTDPLASAASARILQLLLQLDRAPESTSTRTLAIQIDRESRDELPVLPLWELEDHYAWRTQLTGPLETADHLYQGLEAWEIQPWYIKDGG